MTTSVRTHQADPVLHTAHELYRRVRKQVARIARALHRNHVRRATISELYALNDHTLRDIGISRCEIREHVDQLLAGREAWKE